MRLVVCCDGTWNTPNNLDGDTPAPTNVYKFHTAVSENENQRKYYRSGVGTSGGLLRQLSGGALVWNR
ncbi:phospholipase effector Tle1 domain-containing protein [Tateyamaria sp. SN3-11]|uniref:phospholipase effector Tle1 domain-containing protein n=1 Tax=Tateyamaria sp. SN3-11 TaxID=3092147 RepID=UPI0039E85C9C